MYGCVYVDLITSSTSIYFFNFFVCMALAKSKPGIEASYKAKSFMPSASTHLLS